MSTWQPPKPGLNKENCIEAGALRRFLRESRKTVDDRVLVTISKLGNEKAAEQIRHNAGFTGYKPACDEFVRSVLQPAWNERDRILVYCEDVARLAKSEAQAQAPNVSETTVKPTLDPYAREATLASKTDADRVLDWVETERRIEEIVRSTTRSDVYDKCGISLQ